jgi:hypothetical protein
MFSILFVARVSFEQLFVTLGNKGWNCPRE